MADVKFMDLSQNNNPATTDSVLIGNSTGGLKRTPVSAIGDLFAVKGLFHFETVTGTNDPTGDPTGDAMLPKPVSTPVTAPNVTGYNFAFWIDPSTKGAIYPTYVDAPNLNKANVWICFPPSTPPTLVKISVVAVYVNSKVA